MTLPLYIRVTASGGRLGLISMVNTPFESSENLISVSHGEYVQSFCAIAAVELYVPLNTATSGETVGVIVGVADGVGVRVAVGVDVGGD